MSSIIFLVTHIVIGLVLMWSISAENQSEHRGLFAMPDFEHFTHLKKSEEQKTQIKRPR